MLRWLVGAVLLLNVLFFAWSHHWFKALGLGPMPEGEPERIAQQINPKAMQLKADVAQNVPPPAPAAPVLDPASAAAPAQP